MVKAKKVGKAKVQAKAGRKKYIATVMVLKKKIGKAADESTNGRTDSNANSNTGK